MNTALDVSNSAFEGSLYGTSMQSLTLAIWGACRTLDGPGFEPLISKASKLVSFNGKESLKGIFHNGSLKRRGVASRARVSRRSWLMWPSTRGLCGHAFSGSCLG